MNGFLDYLPLLLGGAAALGIFALLAKALQWLHNKLSYIAYFVVRPVPWFYDHGLEALKRRLHISAPQRLQAFGAAAGGDHAPARIQEAGDGGGTESGGGAGDQDGLVHPASLAVHLAWAAQGRPTER